MIELSASVAFMLYLGMTLLILLGLWLKHHWKEKRKLGRVHKFLLLSCEFCHCIYLDDSSKSVTRCPQCHSYNKNNVYQGEI